MICFMSCNARDYARLLDFSLHKEFKIFKHEKHNLTRGEYAQWSLKPWTKTTLALTASVGYYGRYVSFKIVKTTIGSRELGSNLPSLCI